MPVCPHCHTPLPYASAFCPHCGHPLQGNTRVRRGRWQWAALGAVALLGLIAAIWLFVLMSTRWETEEAIRAIQRADALDMVRYEADDTDHVAATDGDVFDFGTLAAGWGASFDGQTVYFSTVSDATGPNGTPLYDLYLASESASPTLVVEAASEFRYSGHTGMLFYLQGAQLYCYQNGAATLLAEKATAFTYASDASHVLYSDGEMLYTLRLGARQNPTPLGDDGYPLAISTDGKTAFFALPARDGVLEVVAARGGGRESVLAQTGGYVYTAFNYNGTEMVAYAENGLWLYRGGRLQRLAENGATLHPAARRFDSLYVGSLCRYTVATVDFSTIVYAERERQGVTTLSYRRNNANPLVLASGSLGTVAVNTDTTLVYYLEGDVLRAASLAGGRLAGTQRIGAGVKTFVAAPDGAHVYYMAGSGDASSLWFATSQGNPKRIGQGVEMYLVSPDGGTCVFLANYSTAGNTGVARVHHPGGQAATASEDAARLFALANDGRFFYGAHQRPAEGSGSRARFDLMFFDNETASLVQADALI